MIMYKCDICKKETNKRTTLEREMGSYGLRLGLDLGVPVWTFYFELCNDCIKDIAKKTKRSDIFRMFQRIVERKKEE